MALSASTTANAWETECSRVPSPASPSPATTVSPTPASVTDDQCPHCRVRCSPCWSRPRRMANELAAWKWCGEESLRSSIPPLKGRRPSGPRLPSADPLGLQAQDAPVIRTVCRSLLFSSGLQVVEALGAENRTDSPTRNRGSQFSVTSRVNSEGVCRLINRVP